MDIMDKDSTKLLGQLKAKLNSEQITTKGYPWNPEKLKLIRDLNWTCPKNIHGTWESKDGILKIVDDQWTIKAGYTYNSCTWVPSGNTDNTPDLPVISLTNQPVRILWKASCIHDKCYEELFDTTFPMKRADADYFFYYETCKTPFKFPKAYWLGVRIFGFPAHAIGILRHLFD